MRSNFDDVGDFHEKFNLDNVTYHGASPRDLDPDVLAFRIEFLREELKEFEDACAAGSEAGKFDALLDLVYVALGTAQLLGYPWQRGWVAVQHANMRKVRAASDGSDSKRGSAYDVVKPPGWEPPDLESILRDYEPDDCKFCGRKLTEGNVKEVIARSTPRVDIHCVCGNYLGSRPV